MLGEMGFQGQTKGSFYSRLGAATADRKIFNDARIHRYRVLDSLLIMLALSFLCRNTTLSVEESSLHASPLYFSAGQGSQSRRKKSVLQYAL